MLFQPMPAKAENALFANEALVCLNSTQKYEKKYQIPQNLLTSISNLETGKWSQTQQTNTSWPWTVNVKGKGYHFETKQEAIEAVENFRAKGIKSIDVGCMQINLLHHAKAFNSLEDAFDPDKNVEYSAKFLTKLNKRRQNWMHAATDYHSKKPSKAARYKKRLMAAMDKMQPTPQIALNKENIKTRTWLSKLLWGDIREGSNNLEISLRGK